MLIAKYQLQNADFEGHTDAPAGTACPSGAASRAWPIELCRFRASMPVPVPPPAGQSAKIRYAVPLRFPGFLFVRAAHLNESEAVRLVTIITPLVRFLQVVVLKLLAGSYWASTLTQYNNRGMWGIGLIRAKLP